MPHANLPLPTIRPLLSNVGRPTYRTTFQIKTRLIPRDAVRGEPIQLAIKIILSWMSLRLRMALSAAQMDGMSFDIDEGVRRLECVSELSEGIWAVRMRHPDEPFKGTEAVAGRSWIVDVALRQIDGNVIFGMYISCVSSSFSQQDIILSRPGIINRLLASFRLVETREVNDEPWILQNESDLEEFRELLTNDKRTMPVIMLTQPDSRLMWGRFKPFLLDGPALAKRLNGLAYVVQMPWELGFKWTKMAGKQWSAYLGAVRTYMPGVNFIDGEPSEHPCTLADRILFWQHDGRTAEAAFEDFLVEKSAVQNAFKRINWGQLLFCSDARTEIAQKLRATAGEASDWKELYEAELSAKDEKIGDFQRQIDATLGMAIELEQQCRALEGDNNKLRYQIDSLRANLEAKTGEPSDARIELPENYDSIPEWIDENLGGQLVLHSRACAGLKDATFSDITLVAKSLLLLANEYRTMRLAINDDGVAKKTFDEALKRLHLTCSGSIDKKRAGEHGETYFVQFPAGNPQRHFLELHLRNGGNSRRPERCLAIYFFWHDQTRQVVVGWLPSHLENRLT